MCKYCERKPEFDTDGSYYYWDNEDPVAWGAYSILYFGVDQDAQMYIVASGDDRTERYYPKFCPGCGRKLVKGSK